jgi:hypothetical protein
VDCGLMTLFPKKPKGFNIEEVWRNGEIDG